MSHTEGPWKVIETQLLGHDGDHVADMSNGLMVVPAIGQPLGNPLADARLIAAAPKMLNALRRASMALAWASSREAVLIDDYEAVNAMVEEAVNGAKK